MEKYLKYIQKYLTLKSGGAGDFDAAQIQQAITLSMQQPAVPDFDAAQVRQAIELSMQQTHFNLYISAGLFFTLPNFQFLNKFTTLLNNIRDRIIRAGYTTIRTTLFDQSDTRNHRAIMGNFPVNREIIENVFFENRYLTVDDLRQFERQNNFLLIDLAHITRYLFAPMDEHRNNKRVLVNIGAEGMPFNPYNNLYINAIYPNFLPDIRIEFLEEFDFIRIQEDMTIVTFVWCICDKRLELKLKEVDNGQTTVIIYNSLVDGSRIVDYRFNVVLEHYSPEIINHLIWD